MIHDYFRLTYAVATGLTLLALTAGCEHRSEGKAGAGGTAAQPLRSVEIVHAERHTVRRSVGEPGQLQAFETTPIHANIAGYVKNWNVNIGAPVKKGQVLAELSVPELDAEHKQKVALIEQSIAKHELAKAAVKVAAADVARAEAKLAEVRTGVRRAEADLARWQAEYKRVEQLHKERALTGTLVDETLSKLRSSEASLRRSMPRSGQPNRLSSSAGRRSTSPRPMLLLPPPPSRSPGRTPTASRHSWATLESKPPSTASSSSEMSRPAI